MSKDQKLALERIVGATEDLGRVQEEARVAINDAARARAGAISDALDVFSVKDLAGELGLSVQRVYRIVREFQE